MGFDLHADLAERQAAGLYRKVRISGSAQGPLMQVDGESLLTFCSNDYLGLANHPAVVAAFQAVAAQYGVGSGAAHLVNGHSALHQQLEEELAAFTGREAALLFSTGYMANTGTIQALLGKDDAVFEDKWNHASLLDAGLHSGARFQRYLHADVANLASRLERSEARRKLVVTDGVFSMDGDTAPLTQLAACAKQHDAWLMVDDAHGLGVLGKTGAGCLEEAGLGQNDVQILMGTLGKGFGTAGAFVAGSRELIDYLTNFARPYIYTTAMPAALAGATLASLSVVKSEPERRHHLNLLIAHFRSAMTSLGFQLMDSSTPVQPVLVGDANAALAMSQRLQQAGILVPAIRPPTVPAGTARLRVTLSASHSLEQVNRLLDVFADIAGAPSWR